MAYEWDERRARRAYWRKIGISAFILAALIGTSAWVVTELGIGI